MPLKKKSMTWERKISTSPQNSRNMWINILTLSLKRKLKNLNLLLNRNSYNKPKKNPLLNNQPRKNNLLKKRQARKKKTQINPTLKFLKLLFPKLKKNCQSSQRSQSKRNKSRRLEKVRISHPRTNKLSNRNRQSKNLKSKNPKSKRFPKSSRFKRKKNWRPR